MLSGVGDRDDAAHGGADQDEPPQPQLVDEARQVTGLIAVLVLPGGRPRALPVAADVWGDEVHAVLEVPRRRVEGLGTRGVAVDAHHGRGAGVAPVEVVDAQAVHRQELARRLHQSRHGSFLLSVVSLR